MRWFIRKPRKETQHCVGWTNGDREAADPPQRFEGKLLECGVALGSWCAVLFVFAVGLARSGVDLMEILKKIISPH